MAHTVWKGHVTFGLVSFPVKLSVAARGQTVGFNQLHAKDHSRGTKHGRTDVSRTAHSG